MTTSAAFDLCQRRLPGPAGRAFALFRWGWLVAGLGGFLCFSLLGGTADWTWRRLPALPDTAGRAGLFAGVCGGRLLVAGGANFPEAMPWAGGRKVWHDDIFLLEKQARTWQRVGHLPRALAYGVSVTLQEGVLCAGGSDAQTHVRETWLFTWRKGDLQSRSLPDLPEPVANACGVARGRTVYLAGGSASPEATQAYRKMWRLDLLRPHPSWVEMEPWPGPARMLAMAAVSQGSVIVCGGVELQPGEDGKPVRRYLRDAYQFTPRRGWRRLADLPRPIAAAPSPAPVTRQGDVLILGGDDGSLVHFEPKAAHPGFRAEVLRYDRQRDLWREVGTVPAPRVTQPTVEWSGTWVLPSGEMRPGVRSPEVWSLRLPRND